MESIDIISQVHVILNTAISGRIEKWNILRYSCAIEVKVVISFPFLMLRSLLIVLFCQNVATR